MLCANIGRSGGGRATGGVIGALTQAGVGKDEADIYAESLRRGGAVVSARVADADAARLQAVLDSSAVRVTDRAAMYRKSGWTTFDPNATPYTPDQVRKERGLTESEVSKMERPPGNGRLFRYRPRNQYNVGGIVNLQRGCAWLRSR